MLSHCFGVNESATVRFCGKAELEVNPENVFFWPYFAVPGCTRETGRSLLWTTVLWSEQVFHAFLIFDFSNRQ